ncbi:hypothetical protein [Streptomyces sp. NPDC026673]|uniref:hypothetical protein n=1 Tax=Streptomyces sp. NPDC026673 TaxID=3155724 RepID=UPI0033DCEC5E
MTPANWKPVITLEHNAGRHVAYSGDHTTVYGAHAAPTGEVFYYSLALHLDPDQAAATIADLPVALILTGDMEHGLLPLTTDTNCWHIAEAFCRLGILPPATELHPNPAIAPADFTIARKRYLLDALTLSRRNDVARARQYIADMHAIRAGFTEARPGPTEQHLSVQIHDDHALGGHGWTPARVTVDEAPSRLGPYDAEISWHRWMGDLVIPRFTADVVQQLAVDTIPWESQVIWRDGYAEVRVENGGPGGLPWIELCLPDDDGRFQIGGSQWTWQAHATIEPAEAGRRIHALFQDRPRTLDTLAEVPAILAAAGLVVGRAHPYGEDRDGLPVPDYFVDPEAAARLIHTIHHGREADQDLLDRIAAVADRTSA